MRAQGWAEAEKAKAQRNPAAMREHEQIFGQAPSYLQLARTARDKGKLDEAVMRAYQGYVAASEEDFRRDGAMNLVGAWSHELGQLIVYDAPSLQESFSFGARFSPDRGTVLTLSKLSSNRGEVRLWDTTTCEPKGGPIRQDGTGIESAMISPDGRSILTWTGKEARLWDAAGNPCGTTPSKWRLLQGCSTYVFCRGLQLRQSHNFHRNWR